MECSYGPVLPYAGVVCCTLWILLGYHLQASEVAEGFAPVAPKNGLKACCWFIHLGAAFLSALL
jgi:hypothetical protein